jgi:hypothetical protein
MFLKKKFRQSTYNIVDAYDELQALSAFLQDPESRSGMSQLIQIGGILAPSVAL